MSPERDTVIIRTAAELSAAARDAKARGLSVAIVPTMGALHSGHVSLIRAAREKAGFVIVSDFVNPTQFGPSEDYDTYPRDEAADLEKVRGVGADVLFVPTVETLYPNGGNSTWVDVPVLGSVLCGASRPGHFRGVATVVTKLLWLSGADYAFFGEKDYQQLVVIRRMVQDLGCPTKIIGMPIVRDYDGLALSSRNVRLSEKARHSALSMITSMRDAAAMFRNGCREAADIRALVSEAVDGSWNAVTEYVRVVDPDTLEIFDGALPDRDLRLLAAIRVDGVRLIDNLLMERGGR